MSEDVGSAEGGLEDFLNSGDRSLEVLFGSQSGNAEGLASKIAKIAKSYGLQGNVHDMDAVSYTHLTLPTILLV